VHANIVIQSRAGTLWGVFERLCCHIQVYIQGTGEDMEPVYLAQVPTARTYVKGTLMKSGKKPRSLELVIPAQAGIQ